MLSCLILPYECYSRNQDSLVQAKIFLPCIVHFVEPVRTALRSVFRDALVHKLVGMCFYFSSFVCLSAQSSLAIHFSTVSTFLPTDVLFTGYFLFPWRRLCGKIPIDSNIHKPACHTQSDLKSPLFPILMNKKGYLEHVYMPKCTKYLPCDWLIRYFH